MSKLQFNIRESDVRTPCSDANLKLGGRNRMCTDRAGLLVCDVRTQMKCAIRASQLSYTTLVLPYNTYVCLLVFLPVSLSVCSTVCLSFFLSVLSVCLSVCVRLHIHSKSTLKYWIFTLEQFHKLIIKHTKLKNDKIHYIIAVYVLPQIISLINFNVK